MPKTKPRAVIVNYGMGNLFSVQNTCAYVGIDAVISDKKQDLESADAVILPGVGAFGDAMENLTQLGLVESLRKCILSQNKPFLGVCLGLQLLMEESHEFGYYKGLGIVRGSVMRFGQQIKDKSGQVVKVPQVGWNQIYRVRESNWDNSLLATIPENEFMYFVHSYHIVPTEADVRVSMTRYGDLEFCSSIQRGLMFGCQFHPERSGVAGLKVYQNFLKQIIQ